MKAATRQICVIACDLDISIHAAREGGDQALERFAAEGKISIHAAREGGDSVIHGSNRSRRKFQSTPPVKAATMVGRGLRLHPDISIHAAREGGDGIHIRPKSSTVHFNPRRP